MTGDTLELAEMFEYLDELRSSGKINMFGAAPVVAGRFGKPLDTGREILKAWMNSDLSLPAIDRAKRAKAFAP
jgi:hypothetical protein